MRALLYGVQCTGKLCARTWSSFEVQRVVVGRGNEVSFAAVCTRCGGAAIVPCRGFDPPLPADPRPDGAVIAEIMAPEAPRRTR